MRNIALAFLVVLTSCFSGAVAAQALEFHGYPCTQDCSGHEAGYVWAMRKGIKNESECTGNSQSFIEGCLAYVEEQASERSFSFE